MCVCMHIYIYIYIYIYVCVCVYMFTFPSACLYRLLTICSVPVPSVALPPHAALPPPQLCSTSAACSLP